MRIWLITVGEPLPIDGANERLYRTGTLARMLVARGHKVIWWTSTFDHARKRQRFNRDSLVDISDHLTIKLLYSVSYTNNVSLRRVINHYGMARKFSVLAASELQPDIILCSLPTIELSLAATQYGKQRGVPVVLDVRDLWPDVFTELVPVWGRGFARLLLYPMFNTVRSACAQATAVSGVTPAFVDWGVSYANRKRTLLDKDFPLGYSEQLPCKEAILEAEQFWEKYGIRKNGNEFIACFFGTISRQFDLATVVKASRQLEQQGLSFRVVLCGDGDKLAFFKRLAKGSQSIVFPGWVGAAEIWTLMRMSSVGLAPYRSSRNFTANLPNKPIEYLSAGLPVVSSLEGILRDLLRVYDCGVSYQNGDADQLAHILRDLYEHPDRLGVLSRYAYSLYQERFVAEKVYSEMTNYLEELAVSAIR